MGFKDLHIDAQKSLLEHIKLTNREMIGMAISLLEESTGIDSDEIRDFIQIEIIKKEKHERNKKSS
jgi:hypothetical protein